MKIVDVELTDGDAKHPEFNRPLLEQQDFKNLHAVVATPCYGGLINQGTVSGFLGSMFKAMHNGISLDFRFLSNESLIPRGRNNLVCQFLASKATHLIFVDADIEFSPDSLLRLLISNREVVTGAYPTKSMPPRYAVEFEQNAEIDSQKFIEIKRAATGFLCIKRSVFEKMKEAYPELHYESDIEALYGFENLPEEQKPSEDQIKILKENLYSFFDTSHHPETNEYLSEDYTFSERWTKIGGKIWLDTTCHLAHIGSISFQVKSEELKTLFVNKGKEINGQ